MFKPLLLITLVLFIIGTGLFFFNENNNYKNLSHSSADGKKLLEKLDTKALNQINIQVEGTIISLLQMQGGGWQEKSLSYEADIQPIQDLLLNLSQMRLENLVTSNPDHHKRFSLLSPPEKMEEWSKEIHAGSVMLFQGDGALILSLLLGKERTNGDGQYIRHAGSDKVYLIPERLQIDAEVDDWLNKILFSLKSDQIAGIKLQSKKDSSFEVVRENAGGKWVHKGEKHNFPDSEKINKILDRLALLTFTKLYKKGQEPENINGSMKEEESLLVSLFDGRIYTLNLHNNDGSNGNYILKVRMGILQDKSTNTKTEDKILRQKMDLFNQKANGRLFEINSWEGNELLLNYQ